MRALIVLALLLAGCAKDTYVVVTVQADNANTLTSITSLALDLSFSPSNTAKVTFNQTATLPTTATIQIRNGSGPLTVIATATGKNGVESGSSQVDVRAGRTSNVTVQLGVVTKLPQDGGTDAGGGDASIGGGTDAGLVDAGLDASTDAATTITLFAAHAAFTSAGTTELEGNFGANPTVLIDNAAVPATVTATPHRIAINWTNTSAPLVGNLQVATSTGVSNGLAFRRPSFALGLQSFLPNYDQTNGARAMPQLTVPRAEPCLITTSRFVYVLGGFDNNANAYSSTEAAAINADSTLGNFQQANALANQRKNFGCARIGNWLYVWGGEDGSSTASAVPMERSLINPDDSLQGFSNYAAADGGTNNIPRRAAFAVIGEYIYAFGGIDGQGASVATVERAPILDAAGNIGAFVAAGTMPSARDSATVEVVANFVYIIGGYSNTSGGLTALNSIVCATVSDGIDVNLAFMTSFTPTLQTARGEHASIVLGDTIYAMGGYSTTTTTPDGGAYQSIESATVTTGAFNYGLLTQSFTTTNGPTLTFPRQRFGLARVGNRLYAIGGAYSPAPGEQYASYASVEVAEVAATGTIQMPSVTPPLAAAVSNHVAVVVGNRIFLLGGTTSDGMTPTDAIQYATVQANGAVGAFTTSTQKIHVARKGHAAMIIDGKLYLAGGDATGTVEAAAISDQFNADATKVFGAFTATNSPLATPRTDFGLFVADASYGNVATRQVYAIGGASATTSDVANYAAGTLGMFGTTANGLPNLYQFSIATLGIASVEDSGPSSNPVARAIISVAGGSGSTPQATFDTAFLSDDGSGTDTLTSFTANNNGIDGARFAHASVYVGNQLYLVGGRDLTSAPIAQSQSATNAYVNLNPNQNTAPYTTGPFTAAFSLGTPRYKFTATVLGDYAYFLGGVDVNGTVLQAGEGALIQ